MLSLNFFFCRFYIILSTLNMGLCAYSSNNMYSWGTLFYKWGFSLFCLADGTERRGAEAGHRSERLHTAGRWRLASSER